MARPSGENACPTEHQSRNQTWLQNRHALACGAAQKPHANARRFCKPMRAARHEEFVAGGKEISSAARAEIRDSTNKLKHIPQILL